MAYLFFQRFEAFQLLSKKTPLIELIIKYNSKKTSILERLYKSVSAVKIQSAMV